MPELPEVQTIINSLKSKIVGKRIKTIMELRKGTLINNSNLILNGSQIISVERRGKYLIFHTDNDLKIITHLRMTGKYIYLKNNNINDEHIRALFKFDDNSLLLFKDVRTFGKISFFYKTDKVRAIEKLGVEPLSDDFDTRYLQKKIATRKSPIKNILLDQTIIAGLGNIYTCEILFRANVNPLRKANELTKTEIKNIIFHTKEILKEAIEKNGTTISDFRNIDDKTGLFQNFLQVYQKKQCKCGAEIKKIKQAGRSTYFCPKCQK